jgi:23S rRNA (uracil1939-C5)-methyltransferase
VTALCRHFGHCGGCVHQDVADDAYRALKREIVRTALDHHGIKAAMDDVVEVPPGTRRRATMKAKLESGRVRLGFHAARTHDIVDLEECLVLTPVLTALLPGLREMLADLLAPAGDAELRLTATDTGIDLGLRWRVPNDAQTLAALARWAGKLKIARISAHGETVVSLGTPSVRLGKARVALPPEVFLQPTREGEAVLQSFVTETLAKAKKVADLFCGCGTFTFPLAEKAKVHAVELETPMLEALAAAAKATPGLKPVTTEKRNLFKRPLGEFELNAYDGVCLDPPRAGALEQAKVLAKSKLKRIAYVSCDAESFARDARVLIDGGYTLARLVPVDQFLWSSHIELAAGFVRG